MKTKLKQNKHQEQFFFLKKGHLSLIPAQFLRNYVQILICNFLPSRPGGLIFLLKDLPKAKATITTICCTKGINFTSNQKANCCPWDLLLVTSSSDSRYSSTGRISGSPKHPHFYAATALSSVVRDLVPEHIHDWKLRGGTPVVSFL